MSHTFIVAAVLAIALLMFLLVHGGTTSRDEARVRPAEVVGAREVGPVGPVGPVEPVEPVLTQSRTGGILDRPATRTEPATERSAFDLDEAQSRCRSMVTTLSESYRSDFREMALEWPDGVTADRAFVPRPDSPVLNPRKLRLDGGELERFEESVGRFNAELETLAGDTHDLVAEATAHYYDSIQGAGWIPEEQLPDLSRREYTGHWNRSLLLRHQGFVRRIEFDTADYVYVEGHMTTIDRLRDERLAAAKAFIGQYGE